VTTTVEKVAELGPYVSLGVTLTDDGGVHPNARQQFYLVDTRLGVPVLPTEIVDQDAMGFIRDTCVADLKKQAKGEGSELFDDLRSSVEMVLARMTSWCFCEAALRIQFDPYTVAAYAYGPKDVILPYGGPLSQYLTVEFKQLVLK
jgi:hypothetical protein